MAESVEVLGVSKLNFGGVNNPPNNLRVLDGENLARTAVDVGLEKPSPVARGGTFLPTAVAGSTEHNDVFEGERGDGKLLIFLTKLLGEDLVAENSWNAVVGGRVGVVDGSLCGLNKPWPQLGAVLEPNLAHDLVYLALYGRVGAFDSAVRLRGAWGHRFKGHPLALDDGLHSLAGLLSRIVNSEDGDMGVSGGRGTEQQQ